MNCRIQFDSAMVRWCESAIVRLCGEPTIGCVQSLVAVEFHIKSAHTPIPGRSIRANTTSVLDTSNVRFGIISCCVRAMFGSTLLGLVG